jgi:hypothetical protein
MRASIMIVPTCRLSRADQILLGIVAALTVASVVGLVLEDRAYFAWREAHPSPPLPYQPRSRWPVWVKKRPSKVCVQAIRAGLVAASLGLAFVAFRPGRSTQPRRRGPGYAAMALSGGLVVATLGSCASSLWIEPLVTGQGSIDAVGGPPLPWTMITERDSLTVFWGIVPAWIYLALTGHWRRPLDPLEKLGRWIGWGWIGIVALNWMGERIQFW